MIMVCFLVCACGCRRDSCQQTSCLVIGRKDFREHLGSLADVMNADLRARILKSVSSGQLSVLTRRERRTAFSLVQSHVYKEGQVINKMVWAVHVPVHGVWL
mgnify:CR=1 FL=1